MTTDPAREAAIEWLTAQFAELEQAVRIGDGPAAVDTFQRMHDNGLPMLASELIGAVMTNVVARLRGRPYPIIQLSDAATSELDQLGATLSAETTEENHDEPAEPGADHDQQRAGDGR